MTGEEEEIEELNCLEKAYALAEEPWTEDDAAKFQVIAESHTFRKAVGYMLRRSVESCGLAALNYPKPDDGITMAKIQGEYAGIQTAARDLLLEEVEE